MIRTINEEPCFKCKTQTNAYDQIRGRLCPACAGVLGPLIDHSEDIEVSASSYHISNALWENWLENARLIFTNEYVSKDSRKKFLFDVRKLLYETAIASAKVFALKEQQPTYRLPNKGVRKKCSRYAECVSQLDWKTNHHRSSFSLDSCSSKCEFYVESYSIWAFEST